MSHKHRHVSAIRQPPVNMGPAHANENVRSGRQRLGGNQCSGNLLQGKSSAIAYKSVKSIATTPSCFSCQPEFQRVSCRTPVPALKEKKENQKGNHPKRQTPNPQSVLVRGQVHQVDDDISTHRRVPGSILMQCYSQPRPGGSRCMCVCARVVIDIAPRHRIARRRNPSSQLDFVTSLLVTVPHHSLMCRKRTGLCEERQRQHHRIGFPVQPSGYEMLNLVAEERGSR
jgi:hypothetical protein